MPTLESLGIHRMTLDEQISLVTAIWNRIAATPPLQGPSDDRISELRQRAVEDDRHPEAGIPWGEVKAQTRERLGL